MEPCDDLAPGWVSLARGQGLACDRTRKLRQRLNIGLLLASERIFLVEAHITSGTILLSTLGSLVSLRPPTASKSPVSFVMISISAARRTIICLPDDEATSFKTVSEPMQIVHSSNRYLALLGLRPAFYFGELHN